MPAAVEWPRRLLGSVRRRWRLRPDSEHEQAFIRIVIVSVFTGFAALGEDEGESLDVGLLLGVSYLAVSCLYFVATLLRPTTISPLRRLTAMVTDFAALSAFLHFGGTAAAPFFPIYLWVSLGNGFRYGLAYLAASVLVSFVGFAVVIATTGFWLENLPLGIGLLLSLILLPLYSASLIRKLTEAKLQAEAASEAKSRFLAIVSHELRTPLNVVIGTADLLSDMGLEREQAGMVRTIRRSGTALLSLIESVLDFSKIEAGRTELNPAPFDLYEHLAAVLESAEFEARQKRLALSAWISPDVPFAVTGDWPHLRQVLTNLLANAIKFTANGGVALTVELAADDAADEGAVTVVFAVADTGVGIAPEHFERIFEGFTQADDSVARRFGGTGLGLAIARQLVELMGGRIDVRSVVEGGSVFTVRLPLVVADEAGGSGREPARCSCILIARDTELIATVTRVLTPTLTLSIVATLDAARRAIAADDCEHHVVLIEAGQVAAETGMPALRASCPGHRLGFVMVDARAEPPRGAWEFVSTVSPSAPPVQFHRVVHAAMAFSGALTATADAGLRRASRRSGLRVLVAEDQELNRMLIEKILRTADHQPRLVADGEQALEALAEGGFDVAILDVNMPRMSGIDVAKLHRMSELGGAPTPLVALSADATLDTRRLCEEAGIDAYLTKPIEAGQLLDTIDRLVGGSIEAVEGATEADPPPSTALRLAPPQPAPVPPRSAVIADIAHHPLYGGAPTGAVDRQAVRNLDLIGGPEFVRGIVRDYVADAAELIGRIRQAVDSRDQPRLREECHALRSSSSNVGARVICQLCNELHGIDEQHLAGDAADRVERLQVELEVYRAEMDRCVAELMRRGAGGL